MRVLIVGAIVVLSAALPLGQPSPALANSIDPVSTALVAPGVEYSTASTTASHGPVAVHALEFDPSTAGMHFETTMALDKVNAREFPTSQAAKISSDGHRVVGTINGSTFGSWPYDLRAARGLNVRDGEVITAGFPRGNDRLPSFAITAEGVTLVGAPRLSVTLTLPDESTAQVERFNQPRRPDEASIFTSRFDTTTRSDTNGLEVVLTGINEPIGTSGTYQGVVQEVRDGLEATPLGPGVVVIAANGSAVDRFSGLVEGDEVTLDVDIDAPWRDTLWAIGGRELVVQDSEVNVFPPDGGSYNDGAPRTVIGITPAGKVLLVVADGRQGHSGGLTIPEAGELLLSMGATDAVNLDGGGSSLMAVRHPGDVGTTIVNKPSDGHERSVNNALHIVSTFPTGDMDQMVVMPGHAQVVAGDTLQFRVGATDAFLNGVPFEPEEVAWSTSNDNATVDDDGLLTAESEGNVTLTAEADGHLASATVKILDGPPNFAPSVPEGLTAVAEDNFVIRLTWEPSTSVTSVTKYRVFRDGTAIGSQQTALEYVDQRKQAKTFTYQVRAIDSGGRKSALSPPITITSVKLVGGPPPSVNPPSVPEALQAVVDNNYVIRLSWEPSASEASGDTLYRVFRDGKAIGKKQLGLTYVDKRKKAKTFTYQVRAIDSDGLKSILSPGLLVTSVKTAHGTTPSPDAPSVPEGLTGIAEDGFVVRLSWEPSTSTATGATKYRVFRNGKAIGKKQVALTFVDKRKKAKTFEYQVRAIDSNGLKSVKSPAITVTTHH